MCVTLNLFLVPGAEDHTAQGTLTCQGAASTAGAKSGVKAGQGEAIVSVVQVPKTVAVMADLACAYC